MSAAHTPGPWEALPEEADKPYIRIRGIRVGARYKIANVLAVSYDGALPREADETQANARLITAAPKLLAGAKRALRVLQGLGHTSQHSNVLEQLEAVIAEATGVTA